MSTRQLAELLAAGSLAVKVSSFPPPPQSAGASRPPPPPDHQPPAQPGVVESSFVGGMIVGVLVGVVLGAVLAILSFALWYNAHCGQVPLFGGSYCR